MLKIPIMFGMLDFYLIKNKIMRTNLHESFIDVALTNKRGIANGDVEIDNFQEDL